MVFHVNWHHSTVRQSEHTKYSTYKQQCIGSKCSLWGMKMTTLPKLVEFSFYPLYDSLLVSLNAEVLVVVVVVGCVQGSWSHVSTFSCYSHWLPLTQNTSKGHENNFQWPVLYYRLSMFCQNCVTCPSMIPGSHHPGTRLRLVPGFRDPGSVLILGHVTQYDNLYLICIAMEMPEYCTKRSICSHYDDVIMSAMASQITSLTIVYSTVYSRADQRKHQSSALLAFVCGIHRWPVNSPHKGPVTRKMFPFDDVIMLHEAIDMRCKCTVPLVC